MNNPTRVKNIDAFSRVVLRDAHVNPSILARYTSLFPGLSFAAGYKILQRVYKFGGHPWVREQLTGLMGKDVVGRFGESKGKIVLHAMAGSIIGVGEVALLPLDVLKIKSQNNPAALKGRGLVGILRTEKLSGLYKGAGWTAARNAPGSFALFGGSALAKEKLFGLKNYNDATFGQNFIASAVGGIASITVASPLDVVKTRLQTRDFANKDSGWKILKDLFKSEGPGALFKGLVPKILVVGPKLVFSFTIAQHTIALFEQWLAPGQPEVNTRALKNKSAA
eukprot:Plantae.Rhodophyta-Hildenbrandia_rubra.ctg47939.p1 GENE.Plantae.Rhodophyta-Hildenbrandia_rubra.ctg47939~~Plantae.Rhodophyta-Hildenbrandia_rubra.ctg47939.p1  ORF type:complete len:314 (+),score=70.29 Plantae.Rhodophyta-Hildenbrandia_rubra.ctg47939:105-944(+)